ncbi:hypothetical protein LSH36_243g01048 [Paralvinella palmiformis]|uniref:H15 domain-containing protein n=1 Tax=Paralvinella palmiformis TaxID=53620 RepID=A0AAD9JLI1_9ANNE|nr:hypothetical protein LSH36_243g01048 [Paralvinella palmiformis]
MSTTDAPKSTTKTTKKAPAKPKEPAAHPKYSEMIKEAVGALKERGGSSRQAILKYIMSHYDVGKEEKVVNQHLKMSLRASVKKGSLKQSKGTGASGSFRLGDNVKKSAAKPKKAKKTKSAAAKKAKKPKAVGEKKAKQTKGVKSPKKAKSGEKAKKGAAKPSKGKKSTATKPKKAGEEKKE